MGPTTEGSSHLCVPRFISGIIMSSDKSIDLSIFANPKVDKSSNLQPRLHGGKKKSSKEKKLSYKRKWYKENAEKKDISGYNQKYYEKHKKQFKAKRQSKKKSQEK